MLPVSLRNVSDNCQSFSQKDSIETSGKDNNKRSMLLRAISNFFFFLS